MSRWYRAYEGTVTDAKLHEAAMVAGCSRAVAIAAWHCLLEACAGWKSAEHGLTPRRVAVILGEPVAAIEALFSAYDEIGLTIGGEVGAWSRRQYDSDNSTERSRKHREAKRNGGATLQGRSATPPEADTDTENREEDTASAASSSASAPEIDLIEAERRCAQAAGVDRLGSFAPIAELLHRQADLERDVLPAIRARPASGGAVNSWKYYAPIIAEAIGRRAPVKEAKGPTPVFVSEGSPEFRAWQEAEPGKHRAIQMKAGLGFYAPTRFPTTISKGQAA